MVYITGDCHADWGRFASERFPTQSTMTRDDFVIVCGDFGIWQDNFKERWWLDWLSKKKFTLLFVDGNHENFDRLYSDEFEIVDFHGGKARKIRDNIYYLMRGYVFNLCGKNFFAFGGARSHDIDDGILNPEDFGSKDDFKKAYKKWDRENKMFRVNHISWWEQEMPSREEMDFGLKTLESYNNEVDFVLSHCCPQEIVDILYSDRLYKPDKDELTLYFNDVLHRINFTKWFFGHHHLDTQVGERFLLLYERIVRVI